MSDSNDRMAFVTGANRGIGFHVARRLGNAGATVLLGSRDLNSGRDAAAKLTAEGLTARPYVLDIANAESVSSCAALVERDFGCLDILVNNAGGGFFARPPSMLNVEELRAVFETNFFGTFSMIKAFLPLLRNSAAGRIVNVSSGTSSLFLHSNPEWIGYGMPYSAYCMSKTALNALTVQMAAELKSSGIKVNSVEPGFTLTDLTTEMHGIGGLTPEAASEVIAKYALIGDDGPTGGFFDASGPFPW